MNASNPVSDKMPLQNAENSSEKTENLPGSEKSGQKLPDKGKKFDEKTRIEELKGIIEAKSGKLEEQLQQIEDLKEEVSQAQKKIDNLRLRNQMLQTENNDLKEGFQKAKSENGQVDEKIKLAQRDAERQLLSLSKENGELKDRIAGLEHKLENATKIATVEPADLKASASNFSINLYQEGGNFRGKIEHPFSKDKKSFVGIDQKAIMDFIHTHTPRLESVANGTVPEMAPRMDSITSLKAIHSKLEIANPYVRAFEPIQLKFSLDLTGITSEYSMLNWNLFVYAKPLAGGMSQQIGELHEGVERPESIERQISASALPPGCYRVESVLTAQTKEGNPIPFSLADRIGVLQVS